MDKAKYLTGLRIGFQTHKEQRIKFEFQIIHYENTILKF